MILSAAACSAASGKAAAAGSRAPSKAAGMTASAAAMTAKGASERTKWTAKGAKRAHEGAMMVVREAAEGMAGPQRAAATPARDGPSAQTAAGDQEKDGDEKTGGHGSCTPSGCCVQTLPGMAFVIACGALLHLRWE